MKRTIRLYGRLRDAGRGDHLEVTLPSDATVKDALAVLKSVLGDVRGCALATDDSVLAPSDPLPKRGVLAALPPVCGG